MRQAFHSAWRKTNGNPTQWTPRKNEPEGFLRPLGKRPRTSLWTDRGLSLNDDRMLARSINHRLKSYTHLQGATTQTTMHRLQLRCVYRTWRRRKLPLPRRIYQLWSQGSPRDKSDSLPLCCCWGIISQHKSTRPRNQSRFVSRHAISSRNTLRWHQSYESTALLARGRLLDYAQLHT